MEESMKRLKVIPILLVLIFAVGCAGLQIRDKKMTPMETATWANGIYIAQYDSYMEKAAWVENLTNEEKVLLRKKKSVLMELQPILKMYSEYVSTGRVPSRELENKIIHLIERLLLEVL